LGINEQGNGMSSRITLILFWLARWCFARQHLWDLSSKLHPSDVAAKRLWVMSHQHFLDDGKIEALVNHLRAQNADRLDLAEAIEKEANYFERNAARMHYPKFRQQGLFVGSGVIEAACKPSSAPGSNAQECFGPFAAPMQSSLSAASATAVSSTTIGSHAGDDCPFQVARPTVSANVVVVSFFLTLCNLLVFLH
jgi:hypothetical protein